MNKTVEDAKTVQEYLFTNILNITISADEDGKCYHAGSVDYPLILPCQGRTIDQAINRFIKAFARHEFLEL